MSGLFMISFPVSGRTAGTIFLPRIVSPKMKPPKGKKKGDKTPCDSSSTASKLLPLLERWNLKPENPFFLIFRLYQQQFLDRSIHEGLIDPMHLSLAGDGTPVRTAAQQRKKRICDCKEKGCSSCNCKRHYSQPDCNWGWDSHRECYFFGYHLYMYVASDSYSDLPVFPLLERGFQTRHAFVSAFLFYDENIPSGIPDRETPSGFRP